MKPTFLKLMAATALMTATAMPVSVVLAAETPAAVSAEVSNFVTQLLAAADSEARINMLTETLVPAPQKAFDILAQVKSTNPDMAKTVLEEIIAVLAGKNDDIVRRLTEENQALLAGTASNVAPAAGPQGGTPGNVGNQGNPSNPENPGQLNQPGAPASPSAPVIL